MLSRIMRLFAQAIVCLTLVAGPAKAVTVPIQWESTPGIGSFATLSGGNTYLGGHAVFGGTGADYYNFHVPFVPVGTTTVEIPTFGSITDLHLAWFNDPAPGALPVYDVAGALMVYAITTAGDWYLRVSGTVLDFENYTVQITTTPLPPALILFGTALIGMTLLGRRRRTTRPPAI